MPQKVAIWLLVLNMGCGTVGTTIISPALSSITEHFSVEESDSQSLLSAYFISLAVFQLFIVFSQIAMVVEGRYSLA